MCENAQTFLTHFVFRCLQCNHFDIKFLKIAFFCNSPYWCYEYIVMYILSRIRGKHLCGISCKILASKTLHDKVLIASNSHCSVLISNTSWIKKMFLKKIFWKNDKCKNRGEKILKYYDDLMSHQLTITPISILIQPVRLVDPKTIIGF